MDDTNNLPDEGGIGEAMPTEAQAEDALSKFFDGPEDPATGDGEEATEDTAQDDAEESDDEPLDSDESEEDEDDSEVDQTKTTTTTRKIRGRQRGNRRPANQVERRNRCNGQRD
jgi:hypothetical protein